MIDGGRPAAGQTQRYARKREAILDAAARHFNARGIRGTALNDVGGSVGLMPNSITYYYRRKEDLAAACYVSTIAWHEALLAETAEHVDPAQRLHAFVTAYFRDLAAIETGARPPQVRLTDMRALPEPQSATVYAAYNAFFRQARTAFFPAAAFPGLDREALRARTHLVVSVVHTVRAWIDRYEAADYHRVGARVADLLLNGLAAPHSLWTGDPPEAVGAPTDPTEPFLRAATALINAEGYRGASVEKISARLSVTKGSFYHHNDNKDDLIAQCFARTFDILRREQEAAEAAGGTGWTRITTCARSLMRHQVSTGGPLLRCTAVGALPDSLRAEIPLTMRRLWERLAFPIGEGIADGSVRAIDPSIAAQVVSSMIDAASDLDRWCEVEAADAAEIFARPLFLGVYAPDR